MELNTDLFLRQSERTEKAFTTRDLMRLFFKHWKIIALTFLIVATATAVGLYYLPPTYTADAKVLIKTEQQGNPSFLSGITAYREQRDPDPVNRKIETEMELLSTRGLSEAVVRKLGLQYDQVYHKPYVHLLNLAADGYYAAKQAMFGGAPPKDRYGFQATVSEFSKSFTVAPVKSKSAETSSNVVEVRLRGVNPGIAQQSVQALLDEYLVFGVDLNQKSGQEAQKVVEENTRDALNRLMALQSQQRQFLAAQGAARNMPYLPTSAGADATGPDSAVRAIQRSGPPAGDTISSPGDHTSISVLKSRLIDMELRLSELRQNYPDDASNVRIAAQSVAQLKKRIQDEVLRNAEYQTTLGLLDRETRAAEQLYLDLKRKLDQISLFLKMNPFEVDNRIVTEPPLVPRSSEWKKDLLVGVLVAALGLVLGIAIAGYREYNDHTLQSADDVERHLGLRTLAMVPVADKKSRSAVLSLGNPLHR
jgi:tyrosine-protein kinase Etk/Wzc